MHSFFLQRVGECSVQSNERFLVPVIPQPTRVLSLIRETNTNVRKVNRINDLLRSQREGNLRVSSVQSPVSALLSHERDQGGEQPQQEYAQCSYQYRNAFGLPVLHVLLAYSYYIDVWGVWFIPPMQRYFYLFTGGGG